MTDVNADILWPLTAKNINTVDGKKNMNRKNKKRQKTYQSKEKSNINQYYTNYFQQTLIKTKHLSSKVFR